MGMRGNGNVESHSRTSLVGSRVSVTGPVFVVFSRVLLLLLF